MKIRPSILVKRRYRHRKQALKYFAVICLWAFAITVGFRMGYGDNIINIKNRIMTDYLRIPEDISCYHADIYDREQQENNFDPMSIFLISTRCDQLLNMHDACAVESVARNDPNRRVNVLIARPINYMQSENNILRGLRESNNVLILSIDVDNYVKNTPLEGIFTDHFMNLGIKRYKRIREVLKLASLYRFGGIVIDLEMLMVKSVEFAGDNWIGKKNFSSFGGGAVGIDKNSAIGKRFLEKSIEIMKIMQNESEIDLGAIMTETYSSVCSTYEANCKDFKVYDPSYFYPLNASQSHKYFEDGYPLSDVHGYYFWDRNDIVHTKTSMYTKIVKEFCPSVYQYINSFYK